MPWVRIDDEFAQHPKIVSLTYRGRWLHIAALCYSNRMLTDGFIPVSMLASLCPHEQTDPIEESAYHLAARLVEVGLWKEADRKGVTGYVIHDFHKYQPSRREVLEERAHLREVRSAAGKNGAVRREANRYANGKQTGKQT
jgi:hypothetical protein